MSAEVEFVGNVDVQHVKDKRPFAAIVSAVSGLSTEAIHQTMVDAGVSSKNGSTELNGRTRLEGHDGSVLIDPIEMEAGATPDDVLKRLDEEFVAGHAVALASRLSMAPRTRKRHWTLLTGYYKQGDEKGAIHAIDPAREHATYFGRHIVKGLITRSMDSGIHAYAVTLEPNVPA